MTRHELQPSARLLCWHAMSNLIVASMVLSFQRALREAHTGAICTVACSLQRCAVTGRYIKEFSARCCLVCLYFLVPWELLFEQ